MSNNTSMTSAPDVESAAAAWYMNAARVTWVYIPPILILIGIAGNTISGIVFMKKAVKKSCIGIGLVCLAAVDTALLLLGLGRYWLIYTFGHDIRQASATVCQFHMSLVYFLFQFEAWLLVIITVERFIAVVFPLKGKFLCTWKNVLIALAVVFGTIFAINLHFYGTVSLRLRNGRWSCGSKEATGYFVKTVWPWIDLLLAMCIPFVLMLVVNIIICYALFKQRRFQRTMSTSSSTGSASRMTSAATIMLLSVTFTFLVLQAPITVYLGLANGDYFVYETELHVATHTFVWAVLNIVAYANYCVNFFLYCVSSRGFRMDIKNLFCCRSQTPKSQTSTALKTRSTSG